MRGQSLQSLKRVALAAALGLGLALCLGPAGAEKGPGEQAIPDREIGLVAGGVLEVPSPDPVRVESGAPGENSPLPRAYPGAPPRIPHAVADLLPITRRDNLCIDCHLVEEAGEGEPTPIPRSHKIDFRNAPGKVGEGVTGARYNCVACHVPRTAAQSLVDSLFGPGAPTAPADAEP